MSDITHAIALALSVLVVGLTYLGWKHVNSRINGLTLDVDMLIAENTLLLRRFNAQETTDEQVEYEMTDFEKRIEKFKLELNTPTYPENVAVLDNPAIYPIPHDEVEDVPLREEEEYAR